MGVCNDAAERSLEEKKQLELRVECADAGQRENRRQINTVLNDLARDLSSLCILPAVRMKE